MRLANRALIAALATLVLCRGVGADFEMPEITDQSPQWARRSGRRSYRTVHDYDGSTIRKGEIYVQCAYRNFDRDPGNADIVDTPA